jgi:hypothetical protein
MPAKAPVGTVVPLDCTQPAMTAPGFGRTSTGRRGRLSVSQRGLGALTTTTAATPADSTTPIKGDQVMEKAKAKAQEIKDGTVGKGFLYRTVEQAKGLDKDRIEVTGSCGHTKVVRVVRKKGDLFKCRACKGGTNVGGSSADKPKAASTPNGNGEKKNGNGNGTKKAPKAKTSKKTAKPKGK